MPYVLEKVKERNIKKYGELTCELCGTTIEHGVFHYDHIIPVSRFSRTLTPFRKNSVRNLQIACESCNLKKSNTIPKKKFKTI